MQTTNIGTPQIVVGLAFIAFALTVLGSNMNQYVIVGLFGAGIIMLACGSVSIYRSIKNVDQKIKI